MSDVILLDMTTLVGVLCQKGEGLSYLNQLGVDLSPSLSQTERQLLLEATSGAREDAHSGTAQQYASLADTVAQSTRRVTLVADLTPRRSLVAFAGDDAVAAFSFTDDAIVASELAVSELSDVVAESLLGALTEGARMTVARWEGSERTLALGCDGQEVIVSGDPMGLAESASKASSLSALSTVVVG